LNWVKGTFYVQEEEFRTFMVKRWENSRRLHQKKRHGGKNNVCQGEVGKKKGRWSIKTEGALISHVKKEQRMICKKRQGVLTRGRDKPTQGERKRGKYISKSNPGSGIRTREKKQSLEKGQ